MRIVIVGLSITSSWGNGHATTYRGLVRELATRGHSVLFLERDVDWYANNRDLPEPPYCDTRLYSSLDQLRRQFSHEVRVADCVIVGSYVPEGIAVGEWVISLASGVTAFYDIDTPITIAALDRGQCEYLSPDLVPFYDLYLSFTGGPLLDYIEREYESPRARPLYCSFDPGVYFPEQADAQWDLGYMGTYSADRQPPLDALGLSAARLWPDARMMVAGACYPDDIEWPANVSHVTHLPPSEHRAFYSSQRFTLNITRAEMIRAGYSPSVRLFEAAGCGTAIITDEWPGLSTFFEPGHEILVTRSAEETVHYLREITDEERRAIGARARARALKEHTAERRAGELESYLIEARTGARVR